MTGFGRAWFLAVLMSVGLPAVEAPSAPARWASFVETNFPFFSSVLDARKVSPPGATNNLTPRGLILNLGQGAWACFDVDLLRISALWTGPGLTPVSMSQGSYHAAGVKAPDGQRVLPEIQGDVWLANGVYPGWQWAEHVTLADPRPPGPDPREVGRGPLSPELGRFRSVRIFPDGVELRYEVQGGLVKERVSAARRAGGAVFRRHLTIGRVRQPLVLALGFPPEGRAAALEVRSFVVGGGTGSAAQVDRHASGLWTVRIEPSAEPIEFEVVIGTRGEGVVSEGGRAEAGGGLASGVRRWPEVLTTRGKLAAPASAYVVDDIALPVDNPWRRNVRLADLAFAGGGLAALVTFDGDVWMVDGLGGELSLVQWRRFASGFHEPMGIAFRSGELFVNDRNGIWRVRDTDGDGEADEHELFSNVYTQTAETREFATGFRVAPDGAFIISKGGQQTSTLGRDNGAVLRVAPDGRTVTTLGWGLRQPFIGVHPRTGLVTASDQQGNYVPATPLHLIRDHRFYGFISTMLPKEEYPAPITEPLTWIPHPVNASGASQVWLTDSRTGPLSGALIHLGYFRPELFLVRWNERASWGGAAVMSLTRDLRFAPLNGAVNPEDGQLYFAGFQIWGTVAQEISGLARLRFTGKPSELPREIAPRREGILVRFEIPVEPGLATNPASYSVERWNYRRTANYGSPHFKLDGSKGQETLPVVSAHLSRDGRAVFLAVADLRPVMQMRVGWSLAAREVGAFAQSAYFTVHDGAVGGGELRPMEAAAEGFEPLAIDWDRRPAPAGLTAATVRPTAEEGRRVAELMGCVACHSNDGSTIGKVGPTWKGLFGRKRELARGGEVVADEAYLRESIQDPPAKVPRGFEQGDIGMPSYEGVLTEAQVEALVMYLKTLR